MNWKELKQMKKDVEREAEERFPNYTVCILIWNDEDWMVCAEYFDEFNQEVKRVVLEKDMKSPEYTSFEISEDEAREDD